MLAPAAGGWLLVLLCVCLLAAWVACCTDNSQSFSQYLWSTQLLLSLSTVHPESCLMFARIVGLVDGKRKRRSDGCICLTVSIVEIKCVTDANDAVLPDSSAIIDDIAREKVISMLLSPADTYVDDFDLEICTKGSYMEGFGMIVHGNIDTIGQQQQQQQKQKQHRCDDDEEEDFSLPGPAALTLKLKALAVTRIAPYPAQVKGLLARASSSLLSSSFISLAARDVTRADLNRLLSPALPTTSCRSGPHVQLAVVMDEPDYLSELLAKQTVKQHVHKMRNYVPVLPVQRVRRMRPEEKELVHFLEARVQECVQHCGGGVTLNEGEGGDERRFKIECGDDDDEILPPSSRGNGDCSDGDDRTCECGLEIPCASSSAAAGIQHLATSSSSSGSNRISSSGGGSSGQLYNLPNSDASAPSAKGFLTRGEYMHGKKEPQIQWVLARLRALADAINTDTDPDDPDDTDSDTAAAGSLERLHVLDVGGGRGDLAVAIAREMQRQGTRHSRVTVVDVNAQSLRGGEQFAAQLGVGDRVHFVESELSAYLEQQQQQRQREEAAAKPHGGEGEGERGQVRMRQVVVALHACGDLSDLALQHARQSGRQEGRQEEGCSGFIVVPCCFSKFFRPRWQGGWSRVWREYAVRHSVAACAETGAGAGEVPTHKTFSKPGLHARPPGLHPLGGGAGGTEDDSVPGRGGDRDESPSSSPSPSSSSEGKKEERVDREEDVEGTLGVWHERRRALGRIAESEPRAYAWRTMKAINLLRLSDFILNPPFFPPCPPESRCSEDQQEDIYLPPPPPPPPGLHPPSPSSLRNNDKDDKVEEDKQAGWAVSLESFSNKYSGRNMVLCGVRNQYSNFL